MNVLLVNPRSRRLRGEALLPPLGLAFVAGAARTAGHRVEILDMNLGDGGDSALRAPMHRISPDVVGITALTVTLREAWAIAGAVKEFSPRTQVVMGGVHPTLEPHQTLEHHGVDYVVRGEGEETFVELLRHLAEPGRVKRLPGLAFREGNGVVATEQRPPIRSLDQLPLPAYDLFDMGRYATPQCASRRIAVMFTSRGCPYGCTFCDAHVVHGREYRCHSPERVTEEMCYLQRTFGVREIVFKDSEFTLDKDRVARICHLIQERQIPIAWNCNSRVGALDIGLLKRMKAAGCRLIQFGVESGDQRILDGLQKGISIRQIEETFRDTRRAGIRTVANCMVGNPGETRESVERTLALVKSIRADYLNVSFITPFPGTALYRMACENNWLLDGYDPLALRQDRCAMNATSMSTAELSGMVDYLQRGFYLRPSYLIRRTLTTNLVEWKKNITGAGRLLASSWNRTGDGIRQ